MRKVAIFSDIHGNLEALRSILMDINLNGITEIICLGDVIGIGPNPSECLDLLISHNVKLVLGNHELYALYTSSIDVNISLLEIEHHEWILSNLSDYQLEYLDSCELSYSFEHRNKKFSFQHFLLNNVPKGRYPYKNIKVLFENVEDIFLTNSFDYIFIGHEHKPFIKSINKRHLIDVGSSGCRHDDLTHYTILELGDKDISLSRRNVTFDREGFIKRLEEMDYPDLPNVAKIFFGVDITF